MKWEWKKTCGFKFFWGSSCTTKIEKNEKVCLIHSRRKCVVCGNQAVKEIVIGKDFITGYSIVKNFCALHNSKDYKGSRIRSSE